MVGRQDTSRVRGIYIHISGRTEICGLYLVTFPDMLIELEMIDINVDCQSGLVMVGTFLADSFTPHLSRCLTVGS